MMWVFFNLIFKLVSSSDVQLMLYNGVLFPNEVGK